MLEAPPAASPAAQQAEVTRLPIAHAHAFTFPKDPNFPSSNEDTFVIAPDRVAVFDGATESFAAARWARECARHWCTGADDWLARARTAYGESIDSGPASWAQEQARQRGSFTTMAALEIRADGPYATIVGDSCVLVAHGDRIVASVPFSSAAQFTSTPTLLASDDVVNEPSPATSTPLLLRPDQLVVLATDAVACWLLDDDQDARSTRLRRLLDVRDPEGWSALVTAERATRAMKVDDATCIVVAFGATS